jgi:hypothetical protein
MQTSEVVKVEGAALVTKEALDECHRTLLDAGKRCVELAKEQHEKGTPIEPRYTARLADGASVTFGSFEDLLAYSNRNDRRITRLTARTEPYHLAPLAVELSFGDGDGYIATVKGEEAEALRIKERCRDIAARVRTYHGWLYSMPMYVLRGVLWVFSTAGLGAFVAGLFFAYTLPWWTFPALAVPVLYAAGYFAMPTLFPPLVIELGQEADKNERRKSIRKWVLTALVLGIPIALAVRFFAKGLGL